VNWATFGAHLMKQKSIVRNAKQKAAKIRASQIGATRSKKQLQKEPTTKFGHTISQTKDQMSASLNEVEEPMDPISEQTKGLVKVERKKVAPPNFFTPTLKSKTLNLKALHLSSWFVLKIDAIKDLLQFKEFLEHIKTKIEKLIAERSDLEG